MLSFLRRTLFIERRKVRSTVTVERRKAVTIASAARTMDDAIDRFSISMKRIKEGTVVS